jgi:hypothetical protein
VIDKIVKDLEVLKDFVDCESDLYNSLVKAIAIVKETRKDKCYDCEYRIGKEVEYD